MKKWMWLYEIAELDKVFSMFERKVGKTSAAILAYTYLIAFYSAVILLGFLIPAMLKRIFLAMPAFAIIVFLFSPFSVWLYVKWAGKHPVTVQRAKQFRMIVTFTAIVFGYSCILGILPLSVPELLNYIFGLFIFAGWGGAIWFCLEKSTQIVRDAETRIQEK